MRIPRTVLAAVVSAALGVAGCGADSGESIDPTPSKLDGSESTEFEADDIERAEGASDAVRDYCSGAVSEAQEVGCLSHVTEGEIP